MRTMHEPFLTPRSNDRVTPLDALDVSARLEQLAALNDNWLDGHGTAPDESGIDWLAQSFKAHYPNDLLMPHVYPTEEGGIRFEWWLDDGRDASLDINLQKQVGYWHAFNLQIGDDSEEVIPLGTADAWQELAEKLRSTAESD